MQLCNSLRPHTRGLLMGCALIASGLTVAAQVVDQNFNSVTGAGGGTFFNGPGFGQVAGWDTGILGENAFAGTAGNARIGAASAFGSTNAGVGGSGAGVVSVAGITYDVLSENFAAVSGTGGGAFLVGNGNPDTNGFTPGWDDGIAGEQAFGGTFGGATLVGSMSAQGQAGAGRLDVDNVSVGAGNWYAGLQFPIGALPGAVALANPSFEAGGTATLEGWQVFSVGWNVLASQAGGFPVTIPHSGSGVLKMFGRFTGSYNVSGVFQSFPAQPGQVWEIDVWSRHNSDDDIGGTQNFAVMRIEFYDAQNAQIGGTEAIVLDAASPQDVWIDNAPFQATAPAGTVSARGILSFVQPASGLYEAGAAHLDDAKFRLVSGPGAFTLANNALTARVRGIADAAGESLGTIQLRIEDPDGNRLVANQLAAAGYQTIGGALSTFSEQNAQGVPTPGAFDPGASTHVVIVAFNNDATAWGTGGTIDLDELALSNDNSTGSAWYAGLFFDDLSIPGGTTLDDLELTADVKGSVAGGGYQLRLEAFRLGSAGLDEDFETVTGSGGGVFLSDTDIDGGATNGYTPDWDSGITGEGAFGGVFGQIDDVPTGGGFFARGITSGGANGNGAGEIVVQDIFPGPGGGWYAGLSWGDQSLASADLSEVVLSANVRGLPGSGGPYGIYELRIEDAQGDRMYFRAIADGTWQSIGGALSTATEGPRLGGGGDGTFDLDSGTYTVVLSFIDPELTWFVGGTLQVDDLFLTPVQTRDEIGRVTFHGVADGQFQSIGGLLSAGETNIGDYEQDFSTAAATGGPLGDWDANLVGEFGFFGLFGNAVSNGGGTATACTNCGVGGGKAAQIIVSDVACGTGGWFAGLVFPNIAADLSGDLAQLYLTAQIRGSADAGAGQTLGTLLFRVEDNDGTSLQFETTATGGFETVGGALSGATLVQIDQGDGVFNRFLDAYAITIAFVGTAANWGPGGTLTIDDLFLTGVKLEDADTYTVVLTFEDEIATWGSAGVLTVDNLRLAPPAPDCPGDLNGDGAVTLTDLAMLLANFGTGSGMTLEDGDIDGDGDVDLTDLAVLLANFGTVCT